MNIDRWIKASAAYHFDNLLSFPLYVDGDERDESLRDWYELRIYAVQRTQIIKFGLTISCCSDLHGNLYSPEDKVTEAIAAMKCFEVRKLEATTPQVDIPNGVDLYATATPMTDRIVTNLGEVETETRHYQSDITCQYSL